jgi:hypothetical protein
MRIGFPNKRIGCNVRAITSKTRAIDYVVTEHTDKRGKIMKSMWTVAALLAVAAIPLIIASRSGKKKSAGTVLSQDDIFEWELTAD